MINPYFIFLVMAVEKCNYAQALAMIKAAKDKSFDDLRGLHR